jgi:alanine or glycine:cation symporter, AGCS family
MNPSDIFFNILGFIDEFFWSYIGFTIICLSGMYLTIKSGGKQFKVLYNFSKTLKDLIDISNDPSKDGLHPIKLLFASVGGMIGIGNIVGVGLAIMIGGPGSIVWMWVASLFGMLIKYSEIYLGVKHRIPDGKGSFNGGPMYFMQDIFKSKIWAKLSAILLCIYGVEVLQFNVLVNSFESTFKFDRNIIVAGLLVLTLISVSGGIRRLSDVCTIVMPFFMIIYVVACLYVVSSNASEIPSMLGYMFKSAFAGQSAIGGFAGSSVLYAAYLGSSKAVYSGDIGIGYDAVVQSETRANCAVKQARLSIIALFMDTCICTLSSLTIVSTGAWYKMNNIDPSEVIPEIFKSYFPYSDYFLTSVFFFAGFTTVIAFFVVGLKAAEFLSEKYGRYLYYIYGIASFIFFSYFSVEKIALIMGVTSVFLVILNITAIMKMRNEIRFTDDETS